MKKTSVRKKIKYLFKRRLFTSAVIVAAGASTRFGGKIPKQFFPLLDRPAIVHTMQAFEQSAVIDEIVVVCRTGEEALYEEYASHYKIRKFKKAVVGGATRQDSVRIGVAATDSAAQYVLIHDGARPLVTPAIIRDVALAAHEHKAACAATPSRDTVKIATETGYIKTTQPREQVWLAATPQGFYKPLYEACASFAQKDHLSVTDDAALLEHYFYRVYLVDCGKENIKLTDPIDAVIAEAILQKRNQGDTI